MYWGGSRAGRRFDLKSRGVNGGDLVFYNGDPRFLSRGLAGRDATTGNNATFEVPDLVGTGNALVTTTSGTSYKTS